MLIKLSTMQFMRKSPTKMSHRLIKEYVLFKNTYIRMLFVCLFVCFIEKLNPLQSYHSVI